MGESTGDGYGVSGTSATGVGVYGRGEKFAGLFDGAVKVQGPVLTRWQSTGGPGGKVYCRVDAQYAPIEVGDLLTTSPTAGHAMKVGNPVQAFGAVIGKALHPLTEGQGLIPILLALE